MQFPEIITLEDARKACRVALTYLDEAEQEFYRETRGRLSTPIEHMAKDVRELRVMGERAYGCASATAATAKNLWTHEPKPNPYGDTGGMVEQAPALLLAEQLLDTATLWLSAEAFRVAFAAAAHAHYQGEVERLTPKLVAL